MGRVRVPRRQLLLLWLAVAWVHLVDICEGETLAEKPPEEEEEREEAGRDLSRDQGLEEETERAVLVLNRDSFDQALRKYRLLLVLFHAPWSELCQALTPEYAKAAALLKEEAAAATLRLATVDGTEELELRREFGVAGYPALKLFRGGNRTHPTDYTGQREAEAIVTWLRQKAGPSALLLANEEEAAAFLDGHTVAVIGFFHDLQDEDVQLFYEVASDATDVAIALTDRPELFQKYGIPGAMVTLFRKTDGDSGNDGPRADFPVDEELGLEAAELAQFIAVQSLELVMEFSSQNSSKIFGAKVPNHMLLFINKTVPAQLELLGGFQEAAALFRGQVLFVLADVHGEGASLLHFFGLKSHEVPALRFIHIETNKKYRLGTEEGLSLTAVSTFCQAVLEGRVQPYLMSEEVPGDWDQRPVKTLVGQNFEQVALDETKDVFVKFYAPWCPHSKAMAPAWQELGEKYQGHEDIIIAEMDATANEVAELPIRAYPTLCYFPAGQGRKMIKYQGTRDLESFSVFLESRGEPLPQEEPIEAETPKELKENQTRPPDTPESRDEL